MPGTAFESNTKVELRRHLDHSAPDECDECEDSSLVVNSSMQAGFLCDSFSQLSWHTAQFCDCCDTLAAAKLRR